MNAEDLFKDIPEDVKARAMKCETPQDMLKLAEEEGIELTMDQLDSVQGGYATCADYGSSVCR